MGAGATFPYPLIFKWIQEFRKIYPNITVNYQAIGSGGGIRAIIDGTVDFGASDAPLNQEEYEKACLKGLILHIPETLGAIAIVYNIPNVDKQLRLTGEIIADIYLGKITSWSDPSITSLNPDISLPDHEIIVIKRSDGSGTTYVFTDYLSAVSEEWKERVGKTKIFNFPEEIGDRGISAKGNQGVAGALIQTPYSIAYIEISYALQNDIPTALIKNADGYFVEANLTTISASAVGAIDYLPYAWESWSNVSIVNAPGTNSYPISSFSYILVYANQTSPEKCSALKKWLTWIVTEGQKYAEPLYYAPLPQPVIERNLAAIELIHCEKTDSMHAVSIINTTNFLLFCTRITSPYLDCKSTKFDKLSNGVPL